MEYLIENWEQMQSILVAAFAILIARELWFFFKKVFLKMLERYSDHIPGVEKAPPAPSEHPLGPKLNEISGHVKHIGHEVDEVKDDIKKIKRTLDGNGNPGGGLVALVQRNEARITGIEKRVK